MLHPYIPPHVPVISLWPPVPPNCFPWFSIHLSTHWERGRGRKREGDNWGTGSPLLSPVLPEERIAKEQQLLLPPPHPTGCIGKVDKDRWSVAVLPPLPYVPRENTLMLFILPVSLPPHPPPCPLHCSRKQLEEMGNSEAEQGKASPLSFLSCAHLVLFEIGEVLPACSSHPTYFIDNHVGTRWRRQPQSSIKGGWFHGTPYFLFSCDCFPKQWSGWGGGWSGGYLHRVFLPFLVGNAH